MCPTALPYSMCSIAISRTPFGTAVKMKPPRLSVTRLKRSKSPSRTEAPSIGWFVPASTMRPMMRPVAPSADAFPNGAEHAPVPPPLSSRGQQPIIPVKTMGRTTRTESPCSSTREGSFRVRSSC